MIGLVLGGLIALSATPQDTTLLRPDLVIGADESDPTTLFTFVVGLSGDASGNILVADMGVSEVSVFDSTGAAVLKISDVGFGPGEIQRPAELAYNENELVVFDVGHNAYLWFTGDGEPVVRVPNPFGRRLGLDPLHTTPSGYVVDGTLGTEPESSFVIRRFRRSPEGPSIDPGVDSIIVRHNPRRAIAVGGATFIPVPMAAGTSWAALGEDIIVSRNGDYILERRSFAGQVDTLYERSSNEGRPVPIPLARRRELEEKFEEDLRAQAVRQGLPSNAFLDEAEIPTDFPPVLAIIADPDERIWVLTGSSSGEPSLDLIDSTGKHVGTVRLQVDQWPNMLLGGIAASSSHLLLVAETAFGTQVVQGFRLPDDLRARD
jgi:hypothetical protein